MAKSEEGKPLQSYSSHQHFLMNGGSNVGPDDSGDGEGAVWGSGQAGAGRRRKGGLLRVELLRRQQGSDLLRPLLQRGDRGDSGGGRAGLAGLRQSDRAG